MNSRTREEWATRLSELTYLTLSRAAAAVLPADAGPLSRRLVPWADRLDPRSARTFEHNAALLAPALEPRGRREAAQAMQANRIRAVLEMLAAEGRGRAWLESRVHAAGLEALDAALAAGGGAVLVVNHLGVWDVGARALAARGHRGAIQVERPLGPWLWRGYTRAKARRGMRLLPRGAAGARELLQALRRGELAVLSWDGSRPRGTQPEQRGLRAAARLAGRAGAPIFRAACLPGHGVYDLILEGPYGPPAGARDAASLARRLLELELTSLRRHLPLWSLAREAGGIRGVEPQCA